MVYPQAAILSIGRIMYRRSAASGAVAALPVVTLSIGYDPPGLQRATGVRIPGFVRDSIAAPASALGEA